MRVRDRLALAMILTFVVIGAMWLLVVAPERTQVSAVSAQITAENAALATAEAQVVTARHAVSAYVGHLNQIDEVMRAVPQVPAEAQIIATIDKLTGTKVNPDFREFDVGANSTSSAGPVALQVTFSFWTTYQGLQDFLKALDSLTATDGNSVDASGRLFTVSTVTLAPLGTPAAPSNVTRATISAQAYVQNGAIVASPATTPSSPATGAAPAG